MYNGTLYTLKNVGIFNKTKKYIGFYKFSVDKKENIMYNV